MISATEAQESYDYGWLNGDARRRNTRPTIATTPRTINRFWFDVGDTDGAMGRGKRAFNAASSYASSDEEKLSYEDGYNGNSQPRFDGYAAWFQAGKDDRASGTAKRWAISGGAAGAGPRPAPRYQPKPNPNAAPLPPVVVNPPTTGGVNQPDVVMRQPGGMPRGPIPPWEWPGSGSESGVILYGPGYYIDFNKLKTRR